MRSLSIYLTGAWHPADSYGKLAIELAKHATAKGIHVNCLGLGPTILDAQSAEVRAITSQPITASLGGIALGWISAISRLSTLFHVGPRLAITMFESSRIPEEWLASLNTLDAVIVPSRFCRDVFRQSGVTIPIYIVPLGVSDHFTFVERPLRFTESRPMTFLAFMDRGHRKGGLVALQGFLRAFGEDKSKKLILKARHDALRFSFSNHNIEVLQDDYDDAQMQSLYTRVDVLVNPHHGEGFGLIPREFAATGGLSLTTAWSGTLDNLEDWGTGLPYELREASWEGNKFLKGRALGDWAYVSEEKLADILQNVAVNWPMFHSLLHKRSRAVKALYSWQRFGDEVLARWEALHDTTYQKSAA